MSDDLLFDPVVQPDRRGRPPKHGVPAPVKPLYKIRHSHHLLAQLIAKGHKNVEVSSLSGYSQSYISTIQRDPAFQELIAYYSEQRKVLFSDVLERMKALQVQTIGEIQERLAEAPEKWSNRELMELAEMLGLGGGHPISEKASTNIRIEFVDGKDKMIDVTPNAEN